MLSGQHPSLFRLGERTIDDDALVAAERPRAPFEVAASPRRRGGHTPFLPSFSGRRVLRAPAPTIRGKYPVLDACLVRLIRQWTRSCEIGELLLQLACSREAFLFLDSSPSHVEQERTRRLPHRKAQPTRRQQLNTLKT